jgi:hypothetical protein
MDSRWRKSTRSANGGDCVEVRQVDGVQVRDSKDRDGPVLTFDTATWTAFVDAVKRGELDR